MFKNILITAVTAAIVSLIVVGLVGGFHQSNLGAVAVTTNLDSLGLGQLAVGSGCDTAYGTCTGLKVDTSGNLVTSKAASSTIQIGATLKAGCLILGDSANAAAPVYITASGATLTAATTTKPAACQTAI